MGKVRIGPAKINPFCLQLSLLQNGNTCVRLQSHVILVFIWLQNIVCREILAHIHSEIRHIIEVKLVANTISSFKITLLLLMILFFPCTNAYF